jgi:hypothetical protein
MRSNVLTAENAGGVAWLAARNVQRTDLKILLSIVLMDRSNHRIGSSVLS